MTRKHTIQRANSHVLIGILARFAHTDLWRSTKRYWLSIKLSVKRPASKPENRSLEEEASWPGEGEGTGVGGSILTTREVETRGGFETKEKQPNQLRRNGSRIKPELRQLVNRLDVLFRGNWSVLWIKCSMSLTQRLGNEQRNEHKVIWILWFEKEATWK